MKAQVGDELVVKGCHVGDPNRKGVIIEIRGEAVAEHISLPAGRRPGRRSADARQDLRVKR